jgi:hypothetical protein
MRLKLGISAKQVHLELKKNRWKSIPKEEYEKTFQKWIERMELCIQNNGDYFEHLIK